MKRKKLKIAGIVVLMLIIAIVVASFIYVSDYYHSTRTISQYQETSTVSVTEENSIIIVGDIQNASKGIIFYPGAKVEYTAYIPLMEEIAKSGYVCFIVKMPGNLAVFGINKADDIIGKYKGIKSWYIAGHSLGGAMASAYAEKKSEKLDGIILFGAYPSSDLSKTDLRLLSIVGTKDKVLNRVKYESSKTNAPPYAEYYEIDGGNHAQYGDYGKQAGDGQATISREEQIKAAAKLVIDWLTVT